MEKVQNVIKWILTFLIVAMIALLVFVRFRYPARYVETGSMLPDYQIGAIVLVDDKAYTKAEPEVGDVAVYSNGGREVMHRIIQKNDDGTYIFKGDNNNASDFAPVTVDEIRGKAVFHFNLFAPIVRRIHHLSSI